MLFRQQKKKCNACLFHICYRVRKALQPRRKCSMSAQVSCRAYRRTHEALLFSSAQNHTTLFFPFHHRSSTHALASAESDVAVRFDLATAAVDAVGAAVDNKPQDDAAAKRAGSMRTVLDLFRLARVVFLIYFVSFALCDVQLDCAKRALRFSCRSRRILIHVQFRWCSFVYLTFTLLSNKLKHAHTRM